MGRVTIFKVLYDFYEGFVILAITQTLPLFVGGIVIMCEGGPAAISLVDKVIVGLHHAEDLNFTRTPTSLIVYIIVGIVGFGIKITHRE